MCEEKWESKELQQITGQQLIVCMVYQFHEVILYKSCVDLSIKPQKQISC